MMLKISRTISGASPSDGSSSIRSFGRPISARPSASIWRSPPDSVPASLLAPVGEPREALVDLVECAPGRRVAVASPRERAELEVVGDAHRREQLALLGHEHEAARDARLDRKSRERLALGRRSRPRTASAP
jgi:hypothetical protein